MHFGFLSGFIKWAVRVVFLILIIIALQITVLAFPQIFVRNSVTVGTVRLYYNGTDKTNMTRLATDSDRRLRVSPYYDSTRVHRVFYFDNPGLFSLFARLSLLPNIPQGFELSIFENAFINGTRVAALKEMTGGIPKYGIWEGDAAHIIAHEIAHQYMIDQIGLGRWKNLPHWKQEGFPEYTANIEPLRRDSTASLIQRVGFLNDNGMWPRNMRWVRIHYEAGILFEYLMDIKGYTLDDILADSVSREKSLAEISEWYNKQVSPDPEI